MDRSEWLQELEEAEMVLIGVGEEFDCVTEMKNAAPDYIDKKNYLTENGLEWLVPAYQEVVREKYHINAIDALEKLKTLLEKKYYYVLSVSTNPWVEKTEWKGGRIASPCGGMTKIQCESGCTGSILDLEEEKKKALFDLLEGENWDSLNTQVEAILGTCPACGKKMVLNNVYCENYLEEGYLPAWDGYKKWLQGSLNRKLLILELGVGMKYPSVIRWPYEKIAFFNQKAKFIRVNQNLYQLTEELKGKGCGIAQNVIDWIDVMC